MASIVVAGDLGLEGADPSVPITHLEHGTLARGALGTGGGACLGGGGAVIDVARFGCVKPHATGHGTRAAGGPARDGVFSGGTQRQHSAAAGAAGPVALGGGDAGGAGAAAARWV